MKEKAVLGDFLCQIAQFRFRGISDRAKLNQHRDFRCFALFNGLCNGTTLTSKALSAFAGVDASQWVYYFSKGSSSLNYTNFFKALINQQRKQCEPEQADTAVGLLKCLLQTEALALQTIRRTARQLDLSQGLQKKFKQLAGLNHYFGIGDLKKYFNSIGVQVADQIARLIVGFFEQDSFKVSFSKFIWFVSPQKNTAYREFKQSADELPLRHRVQNNTQLVDGQQLQQREALLLMKMQKNKRQLQSLQRKKDYNPNTGEPLTFRSDFQGSASLQLQQISPIVPESIISEAKLGQTKQIRQINQFSLDKLSIPALKNEMKTPIRTGLPSQEQDSGPTPMVRLREFNIEKVNGDSQLPNHS